MVSISCTKRSAPSHGGEFGPQHFHRDFSFVLHVLGEIHRRHPTFAELALDFVAVGEVEKRWTPGPRASKTPTTASRRPPSSARRPG